MVGAQNATNMASSFLPLRKSTSETTIIDNTTSSKIQFITPTRSIKFLIISVIQSLTKVTNYFNTIISFVKFFLTIHKPPYRLKNKEILNQNTKFKTLDEPRVIVF